jgi:uncharacterized membrane protein YphA (DoxX/SURF4 family)
MRIYVERVISAPLTSIWQHTQRPELHQRWDLRFTDIEYLPRPDASHPQQFLYATRLGFGVLIEGRGESTGAKESNGAMISALKFWSDDPKSLIREGSGYWKYVPTGDRVRFLTAYDYQVRFGWVGRVVDRLLFRPIMGWATAWSFDRLALWLEKGIGPEQSLNRALTHGIVRISIAFVWIYHGLVPKLLYRHPAELTMLHDIGISAERAAAVLRPIGYAEIMFGLFVLFSWHQRTAFALTAGLMALALASVAWYSPEHVTSAFNVVTLNMLMISMSAVGWLSSRDLPSSCRCLRREPGA